MRPLTSNLRLADARGNALLATRSTGLPRDSVADTSLISAFDRTLLVERKGKLSKSELATVMAGIDVVLGR